jgi:hypothetical protein
VGGGPKGRTEIWSTASDKVHSLVGLLVGGVEACLMYIVEELWAGGLNRYLGM